MYKLHAILPDQSSFLEEKDTDNAEHNSRYNLKRVEVIKILLKHREYRKSISRMRRITSTIQQETRFSNGDNATIESLVII